MIIVEVSGQDLSLPWSSEAHSYPPGVVGEHLVLLPHDAGVGALVDGVGHDAEVVVREGDVPRVGVLQKLSVLIPAVDTKASRLGTLCPPP